jgi:hypothetical protein
MAIVYQAGSTSTTTTIALPFSAAEGRLVILQLYRNDNTIPPSTPTGYTSIGAHSLPTGSTSVRWVYKILDAADITAGVTPTAANATAIMLGLWRSDTTTPIEYVSAVDSSGGPGTSIQIDATTFGCSMVVVMVQSSVGIRTVALTNYTNRSAAYTNTSSLLLDSDGLCAGSPQNNSFSALGAGWRAKLIRFVERPVITYVNGQSAIANTVALPSGVTSNNTAIVIAGRVSTAAPSVASGYISDGTTLGTVFSTCIGHRQLENSDAVAGNIGTWTNAGTVLAMFYSVEGSSPRATLRNFTTAKGDGTVVTLPAQTAADEWQVAMALHGNGTNLRLLAATGYTVRSTAFTLGRAGSWDTQTTPAGVTTVTVNTTGGWGSCSFTLCLDYIFVGTSVSSAPVVANPTLTQKHALTATGVSSVPVDSPPAVVQKQALIATGVKSTPVVANPTLAQGHLVAPALIKSTPVVANPTLTQKHLVAPALISSSPVVANPALVQKHGLTSTSISAIPVVSNPALLQAHGLTFIGVLSVPVVGNPASSVNPPHIQSTPVVSAPTLVQKNVFSPANQSCTPVVGTPALSQVHSFTTPASTAAVPVLGSVTFTTFVYLTATGVTAVPVVDRPEGLLQNAIFPVGLTATPVLGTSTVEQVNYIEAVGITAVPKCKQFTELEAPRRIIATVVLEAPYMGRYANDIASVPVVARPAVVQANSLTAIGVTADLAVVAPRVTQVHAMSVISFIAEPTSTDPSISQRHVLTATKITVTPDAPTISNNQTHALTAIGCAATPDVTAPALYQNHVDTSVQIKSTPVVTAPVFSQRQTATATGISAGPRVGSPGLAQKHKLLGIGVKSVPVVPNPTVTLQEGLKTVQVASIPVVGTPALNQAYQLTVQGISSRAKVTPGPALTIQHAIAATQIVAEPKLSVFAVSQRHPLNSVGNVATPVLGVVTLRQNHLLTSRSIVAWSTVSQNSTLTRILTGQT